MAIVTEAKKAKVFSTSLPQDMYQTVIGRRKHKPKPQERNFSVFGAPKPWCLLESLLTIFKLWNPLLYTVHQERDAQLALENEAQETPKTNMAEATAQSK